VLIAPGEPCVAALKEQCDGDVVVHGSAQLVQALIEGDLIDELRLMVFTVVLGSGKRLFGETSEMKRLRLIDTKAVGDGASSSLTPPTMRAASLGHPSRSISTLTIASDRLSTASSSFWLHR
jgi:dihydrofolate reductase